MTVGPAPVLALLVGILHVSIYVLIRGTAGQRVPILVVAAFLGAWAGDALAARLGADPLRIGDFHLVGASLLAWVGIAIVAIVAVLAEREAHRRTPDAHPMSTAIRRRPAPDPMPDVPTTSAHGPEGSPVPARRPGAQPVPALPGNPIDKGSSHDEPPGPSSSERA